MKAYEVTPEQMEIQRLNSVIRDLRSIIHELQKDNSKQKSLISKLKSKENS
jgi:signal transduction histidine kinase